MGSAAPAASLAPGAGRWLRRAFLFAVVAFAWLRFSENTADNDLWGHVLYGHRMLALGHLETTDELSWTAAGQPWINHEVGAEIVLALIHRNAGGTGLWVFMIAMAAVTVGWACREGTAGRAPIVVTLALLAASTNFIATGYAVRPQLFTMLALVALLHALRRFLDGQLAWGWSLPPVFAAWVNFHGGFLAGWLVLVTAVGVEIVTRLAPPNASPESAASRESTLRPRTLIAVSVVLLLGSTAALALNPQGFRLVGWTIASVQLPRPHITEWQPTAPAFASVPLYFVLVTTALAWIFSGRPRRPWQAVVLALLGGMAVVQQRHAPLFGLANLVFTPEHLADALRRLAAPCASLVRAFQKPLVRGIAALLLVAGGVAAFAASVGSARPHPFTIGVPHDIYPVAAIDFMRRHALTGNTLTFFDWGQQVLWELPDNPVSFDGRLDTVYPRSIMDAHWRLYAGEPPGASLDPDCAAVALLPVDSRAVELLRRAGWQVVYGDPLATVLVRHAADFPSLSPGGANSSSETRFISTPFPNRPPRLAGAGSTP